MGWNVRLFLLLYLMPSWSESSYLSYGVKKLGFLFFLSGSRLTNQWTYKIVGFKSQFSSYYFRMLIVDLETLILCFWVVMPPFLWMSQIFSEHLQPLCCPSHPRFPNSLMHLQIPSSYFRCAFGQINHTNQWVEVLYCLDLYVGVIIMTLGVSGDHLVI